MKNKSSVVATTFVAGAFSVAVFASTPALQVQGAMPVRLKLNDGKTKIVRLMDISLSSAAIKKITTTLNTPLPHYLMRSASMPAKKYVGMASQPVLDQGEWGSCATFSTTASVNATYNLTSGSSVSQVCNLQLGRTINALPGADGGWQGSFGYLVFNQINQYGYLNMDTQTHVGCGGLKAYPTHSGDNGKAMTYEAFAALNPSKQFSKNDWTPIVSYDGSFEPLDPKKAATALDNVKKALTKGYRVVFGTLLDPWVGQAGAVGTYKNISDDTWVLTDQIKKDIKAGIIAGHEIIIDGYDDNACATFADSKGTVKQCGLLRIRNSWGKSAGYKGDYFMSYDHFKGMAIEVYAVGKNVRNTFKPTV